jgi:hypothetical protein
LTVSNETGLDDFGPEPAGIGSGAVHVGEILARGVTIRWDEAVALLQEVLEIVGAGSRDDALFPSLDDVAIDAEGAVSVQSVRRGERGPVAAGRALHALLATADVPVPLRLFVTQANAPETHRSFKSFADGLAYFGKAGRAEMIQAIFERYRASAGTTAATPARPKVPPIPTESRNDPSPELRRRRVPWLMPAAAVVCIASLGAVIWLGVLGGGGNAGASVLAQAKAAIGTVATALKSAPASNTTTTVAEKAPPPGQQGKKASSAPPKPRATQNRIAVPDLEASTASLERPSFSPRSFEPLLTPPRASPAVVPERTEPAASAVPPTREIVVAPRESAEVIYSRDDVDVQPPVMLYPALPPPVFFARSTDTLEVNRMELVVAADGSVERVRLVNGPARMPDMMLLSGAKLWKFTPAVKDGVPVRYRTMVSWTGFP